MWYLNVIILSKTKSNWIIVVGNGKLNKKQWNNLFYIYDKRNKKRVNLLIKHLIKLYVAFRGYAWCPILLNVRLDSYWLGKIAKLLSLVRNNVHVFK